MIFRIYDSKRMDMYIQTIRQNQLARFRNVSWHVYIIYLFIPCRCRRGYIFTRYCRTLSNVSQIIWTIIILGVNTLPFSNKCELVKHTNLEASCGVGFVVLLPVWLPREHPMQQSNDVDGLVQDCSNSIANTLELLQFCTEPSMCLSQDELATCQKLFAFGNSRQNIG